MAYDGLPSGSRNIHDCTHFPNGGGDPDEHRSAHDRVPDVQLLDFGDRGDRTDVAGGEAVTGVNSEAGIVARPRAPLEGLEGVGVAGVMGVRPRMELDGNRTEVARPRDHRRIGIDEEARSHTNGGEPLDRGAQCVRVSGDVQPTFRSNFLASLGNERHLVRAKPFCDRDHLGGAGHLEIEDRSNRCAEPVYVVVLYVSSVFAKVCRDSVSAGSLAFRCREHGIGLDGAARLAKRCDVVDVNVETLIH